MLHVVTAADRHFAMPLAVVGRSLIDHLGIGERAVLHVLDDGLGKRRRRRLLRSWDDPRLTVRWVPVEIPKTAHLKISGHVRRATYFRLLAPDLLPDLPRALYLDADVLVEASVTPLWETDLGTHPVAAAQDLIVRTVSAPNGLRIWKQLGLPESARYFNAGVLLMNLDRWRAEAIPERALALLERHRDTIRWWDQDVLNILFCNRWMELDPRWNLTIQSLGFPPPQELPFSREEYQRLVRTPWITHFLTKRKPWHPGSDHPRRDTFFTYLDRTDWRGWRPSRLRPEWIRHRLRQRIRHWTRRRSR